MIRIQVQNPYMDETYEVNATMADWKQFLLNKSEGNMDFFTFRTLSGQVITINPSNYASVSVVEVIE